MDSAASTFKTSMFRQIPFSLFLFAFAFRERLGDSGDVHCLVMVSSLWQQGEFFYDLIRLGLGMTEEKTERI